MNKRDTITQERLREVLTYDPLTGLFTRNYSYNNNQYRQGTIAGSFAGLYVMICIDKIYYPAHRLAWLYVYGVWPVVIDHINGVRHDNRLVNLRNGTQRANTGNREYHRQGKLVGTSHDQKKNRWKSRINYMGKTYDIGSFGTDIEAHKQYMDCLNSADIGIYINKWRKKRGLKAIRF